MRLEEGDYISIEDCTHGNVYRLDSRNLAYGAWDRKRRAFTGIRSKFGNRYLDCEYHWDVGAPHGTAYPIEDLGPLPDGIPVRQHLGRFDESTGRPVRFDISAGHNDGRKARYLFVDTSEYSNEIRPQILKNEALFEYLNDLTKGAP